jgi:hypothetical protein
VRKRDELSDSGSCLNKARDDEWVFTLLGRDEAAPAGIRGWAAERIRLGLNKPGDPKIVDALRQADFIAAGHAGAPLA